MKNINIIVYLNRFIFGTTIILYATIFLGLMAQIVLGGFQVLSAIILVFFHKRFEPRRRKQLIIYWCFTLFYGVLWYADLKNPSNDFFEMLFYVLIPLSIAGYFTYIIESLKS